MLNKPHHCPDWDFLFIRPGDPEMECCVCSPDPEDDPERVKALWLEERGRESENAAMVCWAKVLRDKNNIITQSARDKIATLLEKTALKEKDHG